MLKTMHVLRYVLWNVYIQCVMTPENPDKFDEEEQLYIDPEECIDCAICEPACPVEAIFVEEEVPEEWEHFIQINADYFQE